MMESGYVNHCVYPCNAPPPKVEVKWDIPERFRGMKPVEIAVSNFGDLYVRFEKPDA